MPSDFDHAFDHASPSKKRELLRAFVHEIEINQIESRATCYIHRLPIDVKVYTAGGAGGLNTEICKRNQQTRTVVERRSGLLFDGALFAFSGIVFLVERTFRWKHGLADAAVISTLS